MVAKTKSKRNWWESTSAADDGLIGDDDSWLEDFEFDTPEDQGDFVDNLWNRWGSYSSKTFNSQYLSEQIFTTQRIVAAQKLVQGFVDTFATGDKHYRVAFDQTVKTAGTNFAAKVITVSHKPLFDKSLTETQANKILTAVTGHECGHVRYGRDQVRAVAKSIDDTQAFRVSNLLGDVHDEGSFRRDFPGYTDLFAPAIDYIARAGIAEAPSGALADADHLNPDAIDPFNLAVAAVRYPAYIDWTKSETARVERDWWTSWANRWGLSDKVADHIAGVKEGLDHLRAAQRDQGEKGEKGEKGETSEKGEKGETTPGSEDLPDFPVDILPSCFAEGIADVARNNGQSIQVSDQQAQQMVEQGKSLVETDFGLGEVYWGPRGIARSRSSVRQSGSASGAIRAAFSRSRTGHTGVQRHLKSGKSTTDQSSISLGRALSSSSGARHSPKASIWSGSSWIARARWAGCRSRTQARSPGPSRRRAGSSLISISTSGAGLTGGRCTRRHSERFGSGRPASRSPTLDTSRTFLRAEPPTLRLSRGQSRQSSSLASTESSRSSSSPATDTAPSTTTRPASSVRLASRASRLLASLSVDSIGTSRRGCTARGTSSDGPGASRQPPSRSASSWLVSRRVGWRKPPTQTGGNEMARGIRLDEPTRAAISAQNAEGRSTKDIATSLGLSYHTVYDYVKQRPSPNGRAENIALKGRILQAVGNHGTVTDMDKLLNLVRYDESGGGNNFGAHEVTHLLYSLSKQNLLRFKVRGPGDDVYDIVATEIGYAKLGLVRHGHRAAPRKREDKTDFRNQPYVAPVVREIEVFDDVETWSPPGLLANPFLEPPEPVVEHWPELERIAHLMEGRAEVQERVDKLLEAALLLEQVDKPESERLARRAEELTGPSISAVDAEYHRYSREHHR